MEIQNIRFYLDKYDIIKIAGGSIIGLSLFYLGKIIRSYSFFKSRGIPTPKYKFISGNLDEIYKTTYAEALREWSKQYGKTYGYKSNLNL